MTYCAIVGYFCTNQIQHIEMLKDWMIPCGWLRAFVAIYPTKNLMQQRSFNKIKLKPRDKTDHGNTSRIQRGQPSSTLISLDSTLLRDLPSNPDTCPMETSCPDWCQVRQTDFWWRYFYRRRRNMLSLCSRYQLPLISRSDYHRDKARASI